MKIKRETTLKEVLKSPERKKILEKHGLPCLFCPMAAQEISFLKIGEVAEKYGIDSEKLIDELNSVEK